MLILKNSFKIQILIWVKNRKNFKIICFKILLKIKIKNNLMDLKINKS
jgi:hypothetical protein